MPALSVAAPTFWCTCGFVSHPRQLLTLIFQAPFVLHCLALLFSSYNNYAVSIIRVLLCTCALYIHAPQSATRAKKQVVTETERELLRTGKFDLLVEEQRRIDAERDAEVCTSLCT